MNYFFFLETVVGSSAVKKIEYSDPGLHSTQLS